MTHKGLAKLVTKEVFSGYAIPVKVVGALCEDGKRRTATVVGGPDTFFSIPARVHAGRTTVTGFIMTKETHEGKDYEFIAYKYRKNHKLVEGV